MERVPYGLSRMVAVNDRGDRLGEDHPRAKLTNADIDLIRELADPQDGANPLSYREIAEKFEVSKGTISDIVSCRRRACIPAGYRRIALAISTPRTQLAMMRG